MDHDRTHAPNGLLRSRTIGWLAVVLMLFQVVLSADHLGAEAARAFGPTPLERAVGILSMCHGDGTIDRAATDPDDPASRAPAAPCVLCSVATLAAAGVVSAAPALAPPVLHPLVDLPAVVTEAPPVRSPLRYGTERGPPASILV